MMIIWLIVIILEVHDYKITLPSIHINTFSLMSQQFNIYCLKYIYVDFVTEDSIPYNGSLKPDARFT